MNRIIIEAIPPAHARLPCYQAQGAGDWFTDGDTLHIRVVAPEMDDEALAVAVHEAIEARLCASAGIAQAAVDTFDAGFTGSGEPGSAPDCPYREPHRAAMLVERAARYVLGLPDGGE